MRFIDLFAGLGGFNLALSELGHECVFASEIDDTLREVYELNFGIMPHGDIRRIHTDDVPAHDILCAGFPCQPFSKAGEQDGLKDPELGGLYRDIMRVVRRHRPRFVILENVPNFEKHDDGKTWKTIGSALKRARYSVQARRLSPHHFAIPQIRDRVYIVASTQPLDCFNWPEPEPNGSMSIRDVLDQNPPDAKKVPEQVERCLTVWQQFLDHIPKDEKVPHPLWSMEFGATYPYEDTVPGRMTIDELRRFKGAHGVSLKGITDLADALRLLPSHARPSKSRANERKFPDWKVGFIRKNRDFYGRHKGWLDKWIPEISDFPSSFQKLEWNCQGEKLRDIRRYVIQIRPSGVRVKRPSTAPSLVAMTATQVPIIAWEGRYMTLAECKRLQSMVDLEHLPFQASKAYEALGNAVNVQVALRVAKALLGGEDQTRRNGASIKSPFASKEVVSVMHVGRGG